MVMEGKWQGKERKWKVNGKEMEEQWQEDNRAMLRNDSEQMGNGKERISTEMTRKGNEIP